ncbi:MAG: CBS domain-containing protein [Candidatus Korarchaeum sp.]|nr:CBS domain-containing protein [Candidatus Korarchaeum sp.]
MRVSEFMSKNPLTVSPEMNLLQALDEMIHRDVWSPVVLSKEGKVLGFITERDLINYVVSQKIPPEQLIVSDVMSRRYGIVKPDHSYLDAATIMMKAKARLVVLEGDKLLGVITAADIIRAYASSSTHPVPLRPYATWKLVSVSMSDSIERAIELMRKERVGSLIVEDEGAPVGIFTERDVVKGFLKEGGDYCDPVGKYATLKLITIDSEASLLDAAKLMVENRVKRLPITQKGVIKGIITARDVVEGIWRESTLNIITP